MKTILSHHHYSDTRISKIVKDYFKSLKYKPTESINIMRVGEDVIITNGHVQRHTDNTVKGKDTVMLVISADGNFVFHYPYCSVTLKSGDILRFDGNKTHALYNSQRTGHFCAIIWDVNKKADLDDLIYQLNDRVKEIHKEYCAKIISS